MQTEILHVLSYFAVFSYPPTAEEILRFSRKPSSLPIITAELQKLVSKKRVLGSSSTPKRYTFSGNIDWFEQYDEKSLRTKDKLALAKNFLGSLKGRHAIRFIGLSGSLAMNSAKEDDDIDLFIISQPGQLWTARLQANVTAIAMGLKRDRFAKKARNKVCLNLFFDASDLQIPPQKRNEYVAHELLQLRPLVDKNHTYAPLMAANKWVTEIFPNSPAMPKPVAILNRLTFMERIIEQIARFVQLILINRNRTTERISSTQLWFFPHDVETMLRKKKVVNK